MDLYHRVVCFQDARQKQFARGSDNSHALELSSCGGGECERFFGRVVYVIVKCGVQGLIYPIKTDVHQNGTTTKTPSLGCVNALLPIRNPKL